MSRTPLVLTAIGLTLACASPTTSAIPAEVGEDAGEANQGRSCAAQLCESDDQGCDGIVLDDVWIWDGRACVEAYASGCGAVGADCGSLYETSSDCRAAWAYCLD